MRLFNNTIAAVATALLLFVAGETTAKITMVQKIYMYGFSASFKDSTVYFTDVMSVDSAWIESKSKFLMGRTDYAQQLKSHFSEQLSQPNRTCVIYYDTKRSKLEKKYSKLKKLYTKKSKSNYDVRVLAGSDFAFKTVDVSQEYNSAYEEKPKKKERKQPKDGGKPGNPGGMPPAGGDRPTPPRM